MADATIEVQTTRGEVLAGSYARVAALLFDTPLAVTRERAQQLAGYLTARMRGVKPEAAITLTDAGASPIAVTMEPDGIAVVSVTGTLVPKGSNMDALSGLVGYDALRGTLDQLANDGNVRGVVVAMDSPGGSVLGVDAAGAAMAALAAAKPVYLVADHLTASAAYWIGAQASRLFVSETSLVGAIGSFMVRHDATAADAKTGDTFTFVANMGRKGDGDPHKALSEDELAAMQRIVAQSDALFFEAVARARGLEASALKKLNGAVLMGQQAIDAGLADQMGTVPDALAALRAALGTPTTSRRARSAAATTRGGGMSNEAQQEKGGTADVIALDDHRKAVAAAAAEAAGSVAAKTAEIFDLVALAGHPAEMARDFLAANKTPAEVRAELQRLKAESAPVITSHVTQRPAAAANGPTIDTAAIYARRAQGCQQARDRVAQQMRG